jgi:hypothetical protein
MSWKEQVAPRPFSFCEMKVWADLDQVQLDKMSLIMDANYKVFVVPKGNLKIHRNGSRFVWHLDSSKTLFDHLTYIPSSNPNDIQSMKKKGEKPDSSRTEILYFAWSYYKNFSLF